MSGLIVFGFGAAGTVRCLYLYYLGFYRTNARFEEGLGRFIGMSSFITLATLGIVVALTSRRDLVITSDGRYGYFKKPFAQNLLVAILGINCLLAGITFTAFAIIQDERDPGGQMIPLIGIGFLAFAIFAYVFIRVVERVGDD